IRARPAPDGQPVRASLPTAAGAVPNLRINRERIGLVLPTSMCSAQIARLAAERMNAKGLAPALGFTRFLALTHSEGCGFGGESMYQLLLRTYRGYATHPNVAATLLLEHGCEKIPNDSMRRQFENAGLPLERFGWASVQLDGGIDKTLAKVETWFAEKAVRQPSVPALATGPAASAGEENKNAAVILAGLNLGVLTVGSLNGASLSPLVALVEDVLHAGGSVLVPESDPLLADARFVDAVLGRTPPHATLAYGQPLTAPGFHVVQTDSDHWVENLAGLGGCGVQVFVGFVGDSVQQGHPMLPVLQIAETGALPAAALVDVDHVFTDDRAANRLALQRLVMTTLERTYTPVANSGGFVDFQLSRGLLGVST
ncbi:MAG: UxaA family hydrolase, partial [Opitutaceae bacterium]